MHFFMMNFQGYIQPGTVQPERSTLAHPLAQNRQSDGSLKAKKSDVFSQSSESEHFRHDVDGNAEAFPAGLDRSSSQKRG